MPHVKDQSGRSIGHGGFGGVSSGGSGTFGGGPPRDDLRIQPEQQAAGSTVRFGLEPGLSYEEWLEAVGISLDVGPIGFVGGSKEASENLEAAFEAYQALTTGISETPDAPIFSLRIDQERTGAGDLRIER